MRRGVSMNINYHKIILQTALAKADDAPLLLCPHPLHSCSRRSEKLSDVVLGMSIGHMAAL
jgi:hypothetical protein